MNKKLNVGDIIEKAKKKPDQAKVSFTLDKHVYKKFQDACKKHDIFASRAIEEFMRDFNNEIEKK
jgi:hypothetical protein